MRTTVGQLLINDALPEEMRDYQRVLNAKGTKALLRAVVEKHPERYKDIVQRLADIGKDVAYSEGSSISLKDLKPARAKQLVIPALRQRIHEIAEDDSLSPKQKDEQIILETGKLLGKLDEAVMLEGAEDGNRLTLYATSGARGNKSQLNQMRGAPLLVQDHRDRPIPVPILSSYAEGMDPVEMWAASYGVRKGYVDIKQCLHEATEVLMADGSVQPIRSIKPGQWVMGSDGAGRLFPTRVLDVFDNGERVCHEYIFRVNRSKRFISLIATEDHNVLARFKYGLKSPYSIYDPMPIPLRKAANCAEPDKNPYVAEPPQGMQRLEGVHESLACVLGLLLGDGCMRGRTYELSCADKLLIEDISPTLLKHGTALTPPTSGYGWTLRYSDYDKNRHGSSGFNSVVERCRMYGLHGKLSHEKVLPSNVWHWDDWSTCQLLAWLFASDGCIDIAKSGTVSIRLQLTSKAIVEEVARLLDLRLGIQTSGLTITPVSALKLGRHEQYRITVSYRPAVLKFAQLIHMPGKKGRQLRAAIDSMPCGSYRNERCGYKSYRKRCVGSCRTFDLHVDNKDHLFVLANGLIVSNSTPKAGFFGKQLANAAHRLIVTKGEPMAGVGLPVSTDDPDNEGAVLARDYDNLKAGTPLTPALLKQLRRKHPMILVHSPMAAPVAGGGIPQWAAGVREHGLAAVGDNVGITAAQAVSEPLAQSAISSKHVAGVAGASGGGSSAASRQGFEAVNRLANIPKHYEGKAPVADVDGHVSKIEDAPQGGKYVYVGDVPHYVDPEQDVIVKSGQVVEAGDVLSSGLPSPADVVRHKGIGEGRRYFMQTMRDVLNNSGVRAHRRNLEMVSRALINHVRITGDNAPSGSLPDDIVEYDDFAARYVPRAGATAAKPALAKNKFLEQPVLHYSIGTRLTPRVIKELQDHKVGQIMVHDDEPDFVPEMQRAMDVMSRDPDWMTRMGGFYLQKNMLDAVHRGASSQVTGSTSYIPALARGVDFARGPE